MTLTSEAINSALESGGITFSNDSSVLFPGSSEFDQATDRWNPSQAPSFSACVIAGNREDVSKAVKLARALEVGFLATSSRHGYGTTMKGLKGGLAIDLSRLKSLQIDRENATATIEPGVYFQEFSERVDEAGFQTPLGSSTVVSPIGVTIGAGVGRWSGVHGLAADNLLSADVVLHDGSVVQASESQNPDLFWALKGAGANLGIVTSATYKLHKLVNGGNVFNADLMFPVDVAPTFFQILKNLVAEGHPELAFIVAIIWSQEAGMPMLAIQCLYHGSEERAREIIAPFLELPTVATQVGPMRWTSVLRDGLFATDQWISAKGTKRSIYTANVRQVDVATLESTVPKIVNFYQKHPTARGSTILLELMPPHPETDVNDDTMAFPWRDAIGNFMFQMSWTDSGTPDHDAAEALGRELRDDFVRTCGYDDLSVYVNYAFGDERQDQIYGGDKLPRLLRLKSKWDPENVFRYSNPLISP